MRTVIHCSIIGGSLRMESDNDYVDITHHFDHSYSKAYVSGDRSEQFMKMLDGPENETATHVENFYFNTDMPLNAINHDMNGNSANISSILNDGVNKATIPNESIPENIDPLITTVTTGGQLFSHKRVADLSSNYTDNKQIHDCQDPERRPLTAYEGMFVVEQHLVCLLCCTCFRTDVALVLHLQVHITYRNSNQETNTEGPSAEINDSHNGKPDNEIVMHSSMVEANAGAFDANVPCPAITKHMWVPRRMQRFIKENGTQVDVLSTKAPDATVPLENISNIQSNEGTDQLPVVCTDYDPMPGFACSRSNEKSLIINKRRPHNTNQQDESKIMIEVITEDVLNENASNTDNMDDKSVVKSETNQLHKCEICSKAYLHKTYRVYRTHPYKCDECNQSFDNSNALLCHMHTHPYNCNVCGMTFLQRWLFLKHVNDEHTGTQFFTIRCERCTTMLSDKESLTKHLKTCSIVKPLTCSICQEIFALQSQLDRHVDKHEKNDLVKCDRCMKTICGPHFLAIHQMTCSVEKTLSCSFCRMRFAIQSKLNGHLRRIHEMKAVTRCDFCTKMICDKSFAQHQRICSKKTFACSICQKRFEFQSNLDKHVTRIHDVVSCELCMKMICKEGLAEHQKICLRKTLTCSFCEKRYSIQATLDKHQQGCTREKIECTVCQMQFACETQLRKHALIHGEKKFKCKFCPKAYSLRRNFTEHMRSVHQRFVCVHCDYQTISKTHVKFHIKSHSGYSPHGGGFKCAYCTQCFRKNVARTKHQNDVHSKYAKQWCRKGGQGPL